MKFMVDVNDASVEQLRSIIDECEKSLRQKESFQELNSHQDLVDRMADKLKESVAINNRTSFKSIPLATLNIDGFGSLNVKNIEYDVDFAYGEIIPYVVHVPEVVLYTPEFIAVSTGVANLITEWLSDPEIATVIFYKEDSLLGNALQEVIQKDLQVWIDLLKWHNDSLTANFIFEVLTSIDD